MTSTPRPHRLHERAALLKHLVGVLERAAGGNGGAAFLRGPAGVGKTTVLEQVAVLAASLGVEVARAAGAAPEVVLPFGVVAELLGPRVGSPGRGSPAESRAATWVAALDVVVERSAGRPLVLLVDDLHWADADSIELLGFLARRLARRPVALVCAMRSWPRTAEREVDRLVRGGVAERLPIGPLSWSAARDLLDELAAGSPDLGLVDEVWRLARGNPFLIERLAALVRRGDRLPSSGVPGSPDHDVVLHALGDLPRSAGEYARAAAVLGEEFRLALVGELTELDEGGAAGALAVLVADGVVRETRPGWAAFVHPMLAHAVLAATDPARRVRLHARAYSRAARAGDLEHAARHAIAADLVGDDEAVGVVVAAARQSLGAGAVLHAIKLLDAAADLCLGAVPPEIVVARGEALLARGRAEDAVAVLAGAPAAPGPGGREALGRVHVEALRLLARAHAFAGDLTAAGDAARRALDLARDRAPALVCAVVAEQVHAVLQSEGPGPAAEVLDVLDPGGEDHGLVPTRCFVRVCAGPDDGSVTEILGLAQGWTADSGAPFDPAVLRLAMCRLAERSAEEERLHREAAAEARAQGRVIAQVALDLSMVDGMVRTGRLGAARDLLVGLAPVEDVVPLMRGAVDLGRAVVACESGDLDAARDRLAAAATDVTWLSRLWRTHLGARIALELGEVGRASAAYEEVADLADRLGVRHPAVVPWVPFAVRTHVAHGATERAAALLPRLGSSPSRSAWGRQQRLAAEALLASAAGDADAARAGYRAALEIRTDLSLDRARILVEHGTQERRANRLRTARDPLAEALAIAEAAGAVRLAERARIELRIAGGRRRREVHSPVGLTAQEQRVAHLASRGLTNAEIARDLSVSVKTVETHLGRVFHKLHLRSRRDLHGLRSSS